MNSETKAVPPPPPPPTHTHTHTKWTNGQMDKGPTGGHCMAVPVIYPPGSYTRAPRYLCLALHNPLQAGASNLQGHYLYHHYVGVGVSY